MSTTATGLNITSKILRYQTDGYLYAIGYPSGAPWNTLNVYRSLNGIDWVLHGSLGTIGAIASEFVKSSDFVINGDIIYWTSYTTDSAASTVQYWVGRYSITSATSLQSVSSTSFPYGSGYSAGRIFTYGNYIIAFGCAGTAIMGNTYQKMYYRLCTAGSAWGSAVLINGSATTSDGMPSHYFFDNVGYVWVTLPYNNSKVKFLIQTGAQTAVTAINTSFNHVPECGDWYNGSYYYLQINYSQGIVNIYKATVNGSTIDNILFKSTSISNTGFTIRAVLQYDSIYNHFFILYCNGIWGGSAYTVYRHFCVYDIASDLFSGWQTASEIVANTYFTIGAFERTVLVTPGNWTGTFAVVTWGFPKTDTLPGNMGFIQDQYNFNFATPAYISAAITLPKLTLESTFLIVDYIAYISASITLPKIQIASDIKLYSVIYSGNFQLGHKFNSALIIAENLKYVLFIQPENIEVPLLNFTIRKYKENLIQKTSVDIRGPIEFYDIISNYFGSNIELNRVYNNYESTMYIGPIYDISTTSDEFVIYSENINLDTSQVIAEPVSVLSRHISTAVIKDRLTPIPSLGLNGYISINGIDVLVEKIVIFISSEQQFMEIN